MPNTLLQGEYGIDVLSLAGLARSAIGAAVAVGNEGYSLSSLAAFSRTLAGNESTAANIAKVLATLIRDLDAKGIIVANKL